LRRVEDSRSLRDAFASASSMVVIGGGWIGLEAAAAAREVGLEVTVLEAGWLPLQRALGDEMARYFADLHSSHGVDLRTATDVYSIDGTGPFEIRVRHGVFKADVVLMAVGAMPNDKLARQAGLAVDDGIVVNEHFATSDPNVLAIGDVARAHNIALATSLRVEHWDNAIRQGKGVAKVLLGWDIAYDWQPYFYTDQYDLGMEYVGHSAPSHDVVVRGDKASGKFIAFWLDGDRLTAGMNVNVWDVNDDIRVLLGQSVDRARLTDPSVPLSEVANGLGVPMP
jgi:3-phenylpropionate/trans-cinnamate dioxygenase ferredoxin reductase subunit